MSSDSSSSSTAVAVVAGMGIAAGIGAAAFLIGQKMASGGSAGAGTPSAAKALEELQATRGGSAPRVSDIGKYIFESTVIVDTRIADMHTVISPAILTEDQSSDNAHATVAEARKQVQDIVHNKDDRLVVIIGPCSIHDVKGALEYASRLVKLKEKHAGELVVVMRVYFEKPRTTIGWKGLINDPDLDGTCNINKGVKLARGLLLQINDLGLPCGCEFLDTITPQYIADLVAWGAIGARTTESQVHRELASGLSMPVGFKNGTSGDVQVALDAIRAAKYPHSFLSVTFQGTVAIVSTKGNEDCHLILRGGADSTNYDEGSVTSAVASLEKAKVNSRVVVDCSHGNSKKLHTNQPLVAAELARQISAGSRAVLGVMVESNLVGGNQPEPLKNGGKPLEYGKSITDACVDWDTTEQVLEMFAKAVAARRASSGGAGNLKAPGSAAFKLFDT